MAKAQRGTRAVAVEPEDRPIEAAPPVAEPVEMAADVIDEDEAFERIDPVTEPKITRPTGRYVALANLWGHTTPKGKSVTIKKGDVLPPSITKEQIAKMMKQGTVGHEMAEG